MDATGEIQSRLDALHDSVAALRSLIDRLGRAGEKADDTGIDGDDGDQSSEADAVFDEAVAADLAAEIADGLREARDELELLQEDVTDLAGVGPAATVSLSLAGPTATSAGAAHAGEHQDRARLQASLARLDEQLASQHASFRRARLRARHILDAVRREEHRAMLAAYAHPPASDYDEDEDAEAASDDDGDDDGDTHRRHDRHHDRHHHAAAARTARSPAARPTAAASAAADVTAALRQTHARIAGEVARSEFAAQTLAESSAALAELGDRYGSSSSKSGGDIASSLHAARGLVRGLVAAHKSDTWYLQTALYMLAATAAWLLFRRLLYGPLWLLLWWPVRTTWAVLATVVGLGRRQASPAISLIPDVGQISPSPSAGTFLTGLPDTPAVVAAATPSPSSNTAPVASGSLVEEVGRIVEGADAAEAQPESDAAPETAPDAGADSNADADANEAPRPNRMKRMWEEDVESAKYAEQEKTEERPKDEL